MNAFKHANRNSANHVEPNSGYLRVTSVTGERCSCGNTEKRKTTQSETRFKKMKAAALHTETACFGRPVLRK